MRVLLLGATGMVGQGVLRECLLDPAVTEVRALGRVGTGQHHPRLRDIVQENMLSFEGSEAALAGLDSCFYCIGVTSAGRGEKQYTSITYDITAALARILSRMNPALTFVLVSAMGADSSGKSGAMWARVKGRTENMILSTFPNGYVFRPGFIQPLHGIQSRTALYRFIYGASTPFMPLLRRAFPGSILSTEEIGRAMLQVARAGAPRRVLEARDVRALLDE